MTSEIALELLAALHGVLVAHLDDDPVLSQSPHVRRAQAAIRKALEDA